MLSPRRACRLLAAAAPIALLMALTSCGVSVEDLCEDMCDCEGCSDAELDECIEEGEAFEEAVDYYGCSSEFEDYMECIDDNAECLNGDWEVRNDEECENTMESCDDDDF